MKRVSPGVLSGELSSGEPSTQFRVLKAQIPRCPHNGLCSSLSLPC